MLRLRQLFVEATAFCSLILMFHTGIGRLSGEKITVFVMVNVDVHLSFLAKGGRFLS